MSIKFTLVLLTGLSLSSCMTHDLRKDVSSLSAYSSHVGKTFKTQRPYVLGEGFELLENHSSPKLHIPTDTSFSLSKVEQIYSAEGSSSERRYQGDVATLYFPHLKELKPTQAITVTLRGKNLIFYPAPWQPVDAVPYVLDAEGVKWPQVLY